MEFTNDRTFTISNFSFAKRKCARETLGEISNTLRNGTPLLCTMKERSGDLETVRRHYGLASRQNTCDDLYRTKDGTHRVGPAFGIL